MTKKVLSAIELGINNQMVNPDAMDVINKLQKHGFDGYIVGGGVRDLLLNKKPKDFDIVTNATPEMIKKIFKRNSIIIGRRFKIVHVVFNNINFNRIINNRPSMEKHIIEISTYRSLKINQKSLNEYGRIMVDNNYGTQKNDSTRRDFTINALYYDPIKENIIDYHDGITDLKTKTIRLIGDPKKRYIEDPVRIIRAIRLSVKLGLNIENKTARCMEEFKPLLIHENHNRMYEEMLKILLSGSAYKCVEELKNFGLPKRVFTLFDKLFLNDKPDLLSLRVLEKTDERLQTENAVSTIFILASLMWNMINRSYEKLLLTGDSPHQALMEAIFQNKSYAHEIGITKNSYSAMTDVWLLQYELENPSSKKITRTLESNRFRQSLHLYNLRNEFGEVDPKLNKWWNSLAESLSNEDKLKIIEDLKKVFKGNKSKKTKTNKSIPEHKRLDKAR